MPEMNRQVLLKRRPNGMPVPGDFSIVEGPLSEPGDGQVLLRGIYLSLDPYMRGRISGQRSYATPTKIGDVIEGRVVGQVMRSRHPGFREGDFAFGGYGWQTHSVVLGGALTKLDPTQAPLSTSLGILGMPGLTAYVGLKTIGQPKAGETVVVSAASGAVGSVVGQLAKIWGARAVGIAGGAAKCGYVRDELGFDACIDYKAGNLAAALKEACASGVDVYFDNVGGEILDTVLARTNLFGRVIVCGTISDYNSSDPYRVRNWRAILVNRLRVRGMIVFDWKERYGEALAALAGYLGQGRLKYRESVVEGLENAPRGLIALLKGENFGKQLVKLS